MIGAGFAFLLAKSGLRLLAAGAKAADLEGVSQTLELVGASTELAEGVHDRPRQVVQATLGRLRKRIEREYRPWLDAEFGTDRADAEATFAAMQELVPQCRPDASAIVAANLDTERIVGLVVGRAAERDEKFKPGRFGHEVLCVLVRRTYEAARDDEKFAELLQLPIQAELLRRTAAQDSKLEAVLAAVSAEKGVQISALRQILEGFGEYDIELDAGWVEERLRAKAGEHRALVERLQRLTNDDPRVQKLRREAAARIDAGHYGDADETLAEAERIDLEVVEELEELTRRRRLSAAESRAGRAAAAHVRLAYRDAAGHHAEAARIVGDDRGARWRYQIRQAASLLSQGTEFGDDAALADSIQTYQGALALVSRTDNAQDRAATQNNLGIALGTLGERESGAARPEEAVAAYDAALSAFPEAGADRCVAVCRANRDRTMALLDQRRNAH